MRMRPNVVSEAGLSTHINQWWSGVPLVTACILVACVLTYVVDVLVGYDSFAEICSSPHFVVTQLQVYRMLTSIFFHKDILHLALNMTALLPIATALERLMGSLRFAHSIVLFAVANDVIHAVIAFLPKLVLGYSGFVDACALGISGVIFALLVVETHAGGGQTRSIFGFFSVPIQWYPWVLLVLFQLLMPQASMLGHLSGIVSGIAYVRGVFTAVLPSAALITSLERMPLMSLLVHRPGFIAGGSNIAAGGSNGSGGGGVFGLPSFTSIGSGGGSASGPNLAAAMTTSWRSMQNTFARWQEQLAHWRQQQQQQRFPAQQQQQSQQSHARHQGAPLSNVHSLNQQHPASYAHGPGPGPGPKGSLGGHAGGGATASAPSPSLFSMGRPPHESVEGAPATGGGGADAIDHRFPGKGRTLTSTTASPDAELASSPLLQPPLHPLNPAAAAAAAAALQRAAASTVAPPQSYPMPQQNQLQQRQQQQQHDQQKQQQQQWQTRQANSLMLQHETVSSQLVPPPQYAAALQQLQAMGFDKEAAGAALVAADGNVELAVDILSSATV